MQKNIGNRGRLLRFILAIILLILAWRFNSWIFLGFSAFVFYEAFASWCFFRQLFKNHPFSKK